MTNLFFCWFGRIGDGLSSCRLRCLFAACGTTARGSCQTGIINNTIERIGLEAIIQLESEIPTIDLVNNFVPLCSRTRHVQQLYSKFAQYAFEV